MSWSVVDCSCVVVVVVWWSVVKCNVVKCTGV